jgi:hypothetical protein
MGKIRILQEELKESLMTKQTWEEFRTSAGSVGTGVDPVRRGASGMPSMRRFARAFRFLVQTS